MGINMFSDLTDEEFLNKHSNHLMAEEQSSSHPVVGSANLYIRRHDNTPSFMTQRYKENPEDVASMGMDIGDYDYIDKLFHCPIVNWVE
jgi:hypothetical protein